MTQSDFAVAIRQIASERGIEVEEVVRAIKRAIEESFADKESPDYAEGLEVEIDVDAGTIAAYVDKKVVDEVTHPATQISLEDALELEPKLRVGDHILVDITQSGDFGRVAAQAARQVISQDIREAEREALLRQFQDKIGTVENAIVQRKDREGNILFEINRATAKMPPADQIPGEFYKSAERYKVLLKEIITDSRGKILVLSRSHPDFLRALFEMEVPEISSGTVEIMAIAREPGARSKVAVRSNADGVDAIGACVGQRGARINAITNELKTQYGEEKIDIIPWDEDTKTFIGNSVRPAEVKDVKIVNEDARQALILVNDEDWSLAIGREGQNVRLAAKLTGWSLDIQGISSFSEGDGTTKFDEDNPDAPVTRPKKAAKPVAEEQAEVETEEETEATE